MALIYEVDLCLNLLDGSTKRANWVETFSGTMTGTNSSRLYLDVGTNSGTLTAIDLSTVGTLGLAMIKNHSTTSTNTLFIALSNDSSQRFISVLPGEAQIFRFGPDVTPYAYFLTVASQMEILALEL